METLKRDDVLYDVNGRPVNLFYDDIAELVDLDLLVLGDNERTRKVLEKAEEQYRRNTIDDELSGLLGENIPVLQKVVGKEHAVEKAKCNVYKIDFAKRVS